MCIPHNIIVPFTILPHIVPLTIQKLCVIFMYVGNEKEMRKAERNLLNPGCGDSENCTPTQKRQREDNNFENGPAPKKARKSTNNTPTTTKKTPASKYNYKEVWNKFHMHVYIHYISKSKHEFSLLIYVYVYAA